MNFFKKKDATVVTFTGGMGAQIISAAIYYKLEMSGVPVYADMSYFEKKEHIATVGVKGDCSHWSWQLGPLGIAMEHFASTKTRKTHRIIADGPEKLSIAIDALKNRQVREKFKIAEKLKGGDFLSDNDCEYLCVHIRRGDYVNVASHLVPDADIMSLVKKFRGLVPKVVVVSDSTVSEDMRNDLLSVFDRVVILNGSDVFVAHCAMRLARILICSNSQFSLVAGLLSLNPNPVVVLPKKWFSAGHERLESSIHDTCNFMLFG